MEGLGKYKPGPIGTSSWSRNSRSLFFLSENQTQLSSSSSVELNNIIMKRKKWTEAEEETLIKKYSELQTTGILSKLKTREKKYQPIAVQVNTQHHLQDPITYPFSWSWRDVSIKIQNMRHQYLGVKQKIKTSDGLGDFIWTDGIDHWTNFLKYKDVFGDVELDTFTHHHHHKLRVSGAGSMEDEEEEGRFVFDSLGGLRFDYEDEEEEDKDVDVDEDFGSSDNDNSLFRGKRLKKDDGIGFLGSQVLEMRDVLGRKEERRREREFKKEEEEMRRYERSLERENQREERMKEREEKVEVRVFECEDRERVWARREFERRVRVEREFDEDRRQWLMKMEEKREEEEMAWRERMVAMQIEHEKQMMQMQADACQNQMQVLGVFVRLVCQFFGSGNDGLGGLGTLPPQDLQNLQHQSDLVGDNGKPDVHSDSHFM
ncbi:hypothetical protein IFM89_039492 [Coptis chinensis]|uniref:Uncharacterized protein n=1 Tax=Coptis chinensis TaxID=261450 RepID=A0A835IZ57_9MAGN|nr:hypothetical protein IFM89_039492 [Coptis chinensis]